MILWSSTSTLKLTTSKHIEGSVGKVVIDQVPNDNGDGQEIPKRIVIDGSCVQDVVHDETTKNGKDRQNDVVDPVAAVASVFDAVPNGQRDQNGLRPVDRMEHGGVGVGGQEP